MRTSNVDTAVRFTAMNVECQILDYTSKGVKVNSQMFNLMIEVALLELSYTFENEKAKDFFVMGVNKSLKNNNPRLFKKVFTNVSDRIFI